MRRRAPSHAGESDRNRSSEGSRCSGGGRFAPQRTLSPQILSITGTFSRFCKVNSIEHAQTLQEADVFRAAAEKHMLPVVDRDAGRLIVVRIRAPAQKRPLLQKRNPSALVSQLARGGQTSEAAAGDDDRRSLAQNARLRTSSRPASASFRRVLTPIRRRKTASGSRSMPRSTLR